MRACATGRVAKLLTALVAVASIAMATSPASARIPRKDKPAGAKAAPSKTEATKAAESKADETKGADAKGTGKATTSAEASSQPAKENQPQVEVYVPSVTGLAEAAARSHSAKLHHAIAGLLGQSTSETDEGIDAVAIMKLLGQIRSWPDTSVSIAIFKQDAEGRARWALRVDWPVAELRARLAGLLESDAGKKLLKNVTLTVQPDGKVSIELPEMSLAVLAESGKGSMIASASGVSLPESIYGEKLAAAAAKKAEGAERPGLAYCRLNLSDDEGGAFSSLSGIRDLRYGCGLDASGAWLERFQLRWNPLAGSAIKMAVGGRVKSGFGCPRDAFVTAVFDAKLGRAIDSMAGLPPMTMADAVSGETAVSVVPGTGFLPIPDVFIQFHLKRREKVIEAIREFIAKDTERRADEDEGPGFDEATVDGWLTFAQRPAATGASLFVPATFRSVLMFPPSDDEARSGLVVLAQTSGFAEDAVANWKKVTAGRRNVTSYPSGDSHWQIVLNWRLIYDYALPYLTLATSMSEEPSPPPEGEEISDALVDGRLDIRIEGGGLRVTHVGPVPFGAVFVPGTIVSALQTHDDPSSEAERAALACRKLRVLYYHAKLFKKDYGRWPATVEELDGYVDFASHPDLLYMPPPKRGFIEGLAASVAGAKRKTPWEMMLHPDEMEYTLYEIEWTPEQWKLKIRGGEFREFETIYVDEDGEIHRVPRGKLAGAESAQAAGKKD